MAGGRDAANCDGGNEDAWVVVVVVGLKVVSVGSSEGFGNELVSGASSGLLTSVAQTAPRVIAHTALCSLFLLLFSSACLLYSNSVHMCVLGVCHLA